MRKAIVYGYARISTMKQHIERQIDNIRQAYPDAVIITEAYTGTKIDRPAFSKLLQQLQPGDTLVFDEVSRMSRNAAEGFDLYRELYEKGVNLIFLKEPHINTDTYKSALKRNVSMTGTSVDYILEGVNKYMMALAREQIQLAFDQAEKEVEYLHKRTSEGVRKAQAAGKRIGRAEGSSAGAGFKEYAKAKAAKEVIKKHCKDFGGTLSDIETMKIAGCARGSYYKYKRELKAEIDA
jgi:DNA invertase Pin-like site-specific DNA recombinase